MTKQQIVVQLVAAKIANSHYVYDTDLSNYGKLADKIIEMFPEHDYTVAGSPLTVHVKRDGKWVEASRAKEKV